METNNVPKANPFRLVRTGVFYLSAVAFVALLVLFVGELLLLPFTAWFGSGVTGVHFIHDVTFMGLLLVVGLAMLVQLYRPAERVVAMQIALVVAVLTVVTALVSSGFDPMLVVLLGPVLLAAALHPARRQLVRFDALSEGTENRVLLALAGVALVPVVVYAVGELTLQATVLDEHAEFGHYAGMATYVLTFVAFAAIAAASGPSHRIGAYLAGLLALLLAAASLFNPTVSAIGPTWSAIAVIWAIAVVVSFEWSVRSAIRRDTTGVEEQMVDEELVNPVD